VLNLFNSHLLVIVLLDFTPARNFDIFATTATELSKEKKKLNERDRMSKVLLDTVQSTSYERN